MRPGRPVGNVDDLPAAGMQTPEQRGPNAQGRTRARLVGHARSAVTKLIPAAEPTSLAWPNAGSPAAVMRLLIPDLFVVHLFSCK